MSRDTSQVPKREKRKGKGGGWLYRDSWIRVACVDIRGFVFGGFIQRDSINRYFCNSVSLSLYTSLFILMGTPNERLMGVYMQTIRMFSPGKGIVT